MEDFAKSFKDFNEKLVSDERVNDLIKYGLFGTNILNIRNLINEHYYASDDLEISSFCEDYLIVAYSKYQDIVCLSVVDANNNYRGIKITQMMYDHMEIELSNGLSNNIFDINLVDDDVKITKKNPKRKIR